MGPGIKQKEDRLKNNYKLTEGKSLECQTKLIHLCH